MKSGAEELNLPHPNIYYFLYEYSHIKKEVSLPHPVLYFDEKLSVLSEFPH
jgi:hypothetical protein